MEEFRKPHFSIERWGFYFQKIKRPIMKISVLFLACILLLFTLSCGSGGSSSGSSSGYIGGNWSGQWIRTRYSGQGGAVSANFQQSGNQISGIASATNTALGDVTGNISGTISNSDGPGTINMGVAWTKGGSVTYSGSYGNYSASNGDFETFL
jgi:hypothetical protein